MLAELHTTSPASLRAVFRFGRSRQVRIELDIALTGGGDHSQNQLAEIGRILDGSRYYQRLDPDCRECDWHQVLSLITRCHDQVRLASSHLVTSIRIEDGEDMAQDVQSRMTLAKNTVAAAKAM